MIPDWSRVRQFEWIIGAATVYDKGSCLAIDRNVSLSATEEFVPVSAVSAPFNLLAHSRNSAVTLEINAPTPAITVTWMSLHIWRFASIRFGRSLNLKPSFSWWHHFSNLSKPSHCPLLAHRRRDVAMEICPLSGTSDHSLYDRIGGALLPTRPSRFARLRLVSTLSRCPCMLQYEVMMETFGGTTVTTGSRNRCQRRRHPRARQEAASRFRHAC